MVSLRKKYSSLLLEGDAMRRGRPKPPPRAIVANLTLCYNFIHEKFACERSISATDWFVVRLSSHASAALRCTRFIRRVVASATGREDEQGGMCKGESMGGMGMLGGMEFMGFMGRMGQMGCDLCGGGVGSGFLGRDFVRRRRGGVYLCGHGKHMSD